MPIVNYVDGMQGHNLLLFYVLWFHSHNKTSKHITILFYVHYYMHLYSKDREPELCMYFELLVLKAYSKFFLLLVFNMATCSSQAFFLNFSLTIFSAYCTPYLAVLCNDMFRLFV